MKKIDQDGKHNQKTDFRRNRDNLENRKELSKK